MKDKLGILGGLGPLASADFLLSIYERNLGKVEQEAPAVILYSDPTFPDRTNSFLRGQDDALLAPLQTALARLQDCGASRIVIACVTMHHLIPRLGAELRNKIISLVDVILEALIASRSQALLLATTGTRQMQIFERSEYWSEAAAYAVLPDAEDQYKLHERIYREVKLNADPLDLSSFVAGLCRKYQVGQFVAGCTELHRFSRHLLFAKQMTVPARVIDPLLIIAENYEEFVHGQTRPHERVRSECEKVRL